MAPLARLADQHLLKTIASFPTEVRDDPTNRTFYLSLAIVRHFLGAAWADEHVQDNGEPGYVRLNWRDRTQTQIQSFRIVDLGELLFNLQHMVGFDECIRRMRDGNIEGTYAELDLGRMLYQSGIEFRFVVGSGKRGDDFDIEMTLNDGVTVCADAKCKIEATQFSEKTLLNSLQSARSQFPKDKPSIIFVKVPPRWLSERSDLKEQLTRIANDFLRGTGRVVSVKYYVSHIRWEDGHVSHIQAFQEINNHHAINRFGSSRNWDMFEESDETSGPNGFENYSDVPIRWRRLIYYPQVSAADNRMRDVQSSRTS
ncbi:hypothetical protein [Bradyrhizobium sp. Ce-3]|uniref:hypothetical protein n=1 Tax=Bradyrhizobium sp. Ce-3 TaxID=2913970 RepID=UPI001FC877DA|nr:hypothetical protein [Bradyrhizobium sp. Ce-3]GKQ51869.1 hypothetical protein BRSPCE3_27240 [Bradyrhizobium sp. Ce-3]